MKQKFADDEAKRMLKDFMHDSPPSPEDAFEKESESRTYSNPFHRKPGDATKAMNATGTTNPNVLWFSNYKQPKWNAKQVHDWREFTNKELIRGDLNKFSCAICNDQKYILHQVTAILDKNNCRTEKIDCPRCVARKESEALSTECGYDCKRDCVDYCKNSAERSRRVSDCCAAGVHVSTMSNSTNFHCCNECGKPCDAIKEEDATDKKD
jgi:hypothetical protein